jgi:hypothetical protein
LQKPPMGWHKCNVDADFHHEVNNSVGWCLRGHSRNFNLAGTIWKEGNCSIIEGKLMLYLKLY